MKTISLMMLALMLTSAGTDTSLSKKEIRYSTKYLDSSQSLAFSAIENLSLEQWNYKPDADSWSIAGVCEHLLITEQNVLAMIQNKLITDESNRAIEEDEGITNEELIQRIKDRGPDKRVKTSEKFEPSGILASPADFMNKYSNARAATIDYIKNTDVDLSAYYGQSPAGKLSAYQWTILLSAHAERHTAQIVEVQSSSNYPL